MNIEEVTEIDHLIDFTDQEILRATKYKCVKNSLNPDCLTYKIKIGKMIFTIKISHENSHCLLDDFTKDRLAQGAINFLLVRLRQRTGLYPGKLSN